MRSVKPVVSLAAKAVAATAVFLVLGNLLILAASWWAQGATSSTQVDDVAGISNLTAVDNHLWRGGAPSRRATATWPQRGSPPWSTSGRRTGSTPTRPWWRSWACGW